jgi:hypothetical protein
MALQEILDEKVSGGAFVRYLEIPDGYIQSMAGCDLYVNIDWSGEIWVALDDCGEPWEVNSDWDTYKQITRFILELDASKDDGIHGKLVEGVL